VVLLNPYSGALHTRPIKESVYEKDETDPVAGFKVKEAMLSYSFKLKNQFPYKKG